MLADMPTYVKHSFDATLSACLFHSCSYVASSSLVLIDMSYKALVQLRLNVEFLLIQRRRTQADLAAEMGIDATTLNKFLHGKREIQFKHLDGMASFFGLQTYELFRPGISPLSERRIIKDRRQGLDRRRAQTDRLAHLPVRKRPT